MAVRIRPNVLRMIPYSPGKPIDEVKRELDLDRVVKLASNENPFGPSPRAVEAMRRAAAEVHLYPDGAAYELREALSEKYSIPTENLIIGNGSDELIHLIGLIVLDGDEDEVVIGKPSFVRYNAAAHLSASRLIEVPLDSHLRHDLSAMAKAVTERTKLIFIANPHNPTGTYVSRAEIERFLDDIPPSALLVLDEAYYEFAMDVPDYPNSRDFVKAHRNVVGLRTFSKAYGLAGIRLGFGFAPEAITDAVNRIREPFSVNAVAQAAGVAALADEEHVRRTVENNSQGRNRLMEIFSRLGAAPYESHANFVYADLRQPAQPVFQALLKKGIITRSGEVFGMPSFLRVSVGTEEEMDLFVEAIEGCMREAVTP